MVSDEIRTILVAGSLGTADVDLFLGDWPSSPVQPMVCTVIAETVGLAPAHVFSESAIAIEQPRVQVKTRGLPQDYLGPRRQIERIYQLLTARGATTVSGARHLDIAAVQAPFLLGRDEQKRWMFIVNFQVMKELSSTA